MILLKKLLTELDKLEIVLENENAKENILDRIEKMKKEANKK